MNCWWTSSGCVTIETLRCLHQWAHPPSQGSATGMKEKLGGGRKTSLEASRQHVLLHGEPAWIRKKNAHMQNIAEHSIAILQFRIAEAQG